MIQTTLFELAKLLGIAAPLHDIEFCGMSINTRTLAAGNLFIAIRGAQFDGHHFIADAVKKGAIAALVHQKIDHPLPQLVVNDTILALGQIAKNWRDSFVLPLIGVTGSNGKTTLKNMLAAILSAACPQPATQVLATEGNLNNDIGLPLTLARLSSQHRYAVTEMGMNHFGEIEYLTRLAQPTVAVINNAAAAHLEGLTNLAGVAKAKGEIFLGLAKNGTAILNRDDAYYSYWLELTSSHPVMTFGLHPTADITTTYAAGHPLTIHTPQGEFIVNLALLGAHNALNALAATATALAVGIDLAAIKTGLENVTPAPGRMQQFVLANHSKVIDDTYNANPFSLQAAVQTLAAFSGIKILVLGDMKELGSDAEQFHFEAGQQIKTAGIDYLFTLGNLSAATTKGFGTRAQHFTERDSLIAALQSYLKNPVTLLVKGSRSMQMEKIVAGILPEASLKHTAH